MGLYDNYKLQNSTGIPVFAGGMSNELSRVQTVLNQQYEAAQEGMGTIGELLTQAPVREQDKEVLTQLAGEVNSKMDEWSNRGDYENLYSHVSRYGRNVKNRVGILAQQKKSEDDYVKAMMDTGNTKEDVNIALAMARDNSSAVQFTPDGRYVGGFKPGIMLEKPVNVVESLKKALHGHLVPNLDETNTKIDNGQIMVLENNQWKGISPEQLQQTMDAAMQIDPDLKKSLEQRVLLDTYAATRNLTDENIVEFFNSPNADPQMKAAIEREMAKGKSPKEALGTIEAQRSARQWYNNALQYSRGMLNTEHTQKIEKEAGWQAKEDYKSAQDFDYFKKKEDYKKKLEDDANAPGVLMMPGAGIDISDATTYGDLDKKVVESEKNTAILKGQLSKYYDFNEDGSIKSQKAAIPNNITGMVQSYVDQYNEMSTHAGEYRSLKEHALNQAANKFPVTVNGKQQTFSTYKELEDYVNGKTQTDQAKVIRESGNDSYQITSGYGAQTKSTGKTMSKEELAKIVEDGGKLQYSYGLMGRRTTVAGVTTKEGKYIPFAHSENATKTNLVSKLDAKDGTAILSKVKTDATNNFDSYRKNASVHTTEFTFDTKGKENSPATSLNIAVSDAIAGNPGAFKLHTYGKTSKDELDWEEEGLDLSKAEVKSYSAYKGGTVKVNLTVPYKDGKDNKTKVISAIVPSGSNLSQRINQLTGGNKDPYVAAAGNSIYKGSIANQLAFSPKQGIPVEVGNKLPNGKVPVRIHTEASAGVNKFFIEYYDESSNQYKKVKARDNVTEYTTTDPTEAANAAEYFYKNYYSK